MPKTPFESFDKFDQDNKFPHKSSRKILDDLRDDFDGVMGIVAGPGITVDSTDPSYPVITATFPGGSGGNGSGGLWLKSVTRQIGESSENDIMYTEQTVYGGIKGLIGNAMNITLTIAGLPGSNSEGEVIQVYAVAGSFTPSDLVKYPTAVDEPVTATYSGLVESATDGSIDHLVFTANLTIPAFVDGKVQIVVLSDSGAYVLLEYTEENIAHLLTAHVETATTDIAPYRTGFTAGDTITISFTADAPVYSILVWPFDANSFSMGWEPEEYVLPSPVDSGTVEIIVAVTTPHLLTGLSTTALRVSACRYGQPTAGIVTDNEFTFDQHSPLLVSNTNDTNYEYPGAQTAIKGTDQVAITLSAAYADQITVNLNSEIELVTPGDIALVDGEATFLVQRSTEDFTGRVYGTYSALNFNNGKTSTSGNVQLLFVDIEGTTFNDPVISIGSGLPLMSEADPGDVEPSTLYLTSTVRLSNPTGHITFPGLSLSSGWSSTNGYVWQIQVKALDASSRGEFTTLSADPIVLDGLTTGAGSAVTDATGGYTISGFGQRMVTISTPFATYLDLTGIVDIDYIAGLTVLDIAFQPVDFTVITDDMDPDYHGLNAITFTDPDFYNSNATGTLFVWVSQASAS